MNIYPDKLIYYDDFYRHPTSNNDINIYRPQQNPTKTKNIYINDNKMSLFKIERSPVRYRRMKYITTLNSPSKTRFIIDLKKQSPSITKNNFIINTSDDLSRNITKRNLFPSISNYSLYDSNKRQIINKENTAVRFCGRKSEIIPINKIFPKKIVISPQRIRENNKLLFNNSNNYFSVKENNNDNIIKNDKKLQNENLYNQRYKNININTLSTSLSNNNIKSNQDVESIKYLLSENNINNNYIPKNNVLLSKSTNFIKNLSNKNCNKRYIFDTKNKTNSIFSSAKIKNIFHPENIKVSLDNLLISSSENSGNHNKCLTERNISIPTFINCSPQKNRKMLIYKFSPSTNISNRNKLICINRTPSNYITNNNIFIKLKDNPMKLNIDTNDKDKLSRIKKILEKGLDRNEIKENPIEQNTYQKEELNNDIKNKNNNNNKITFGKKIIKHQKKNLKKINYSTYQNIVSKFQKTKRIPPRYITKNIFNLENKDNTKNIIADSEKYNNNKLIEIKATNTMNNKILYKNTNQFQIKKCIRMKENNFNRKIIDTKNDNVNENKKHKDLDANTISLSNSKINDSITQKKSENDQNSIRIPFFIENFSIEFNSKNKILSIVGIKKYVNNNFSQKKLKNTVDDSEDEFQLTKEIQLLKNTLTTRKDIATKLIKIIKSLKITKGFQTTILSTKNKNKSKTKYYKMNFYFSDNIN